jgi:hypothetical protein
MDPEGPSTLRERWVFRKMTTLHEDGAHNGSQTACVAFKFGPAFGLRRNALELAQSERHRPPSPSALVRQFWSGPTIFMVRPF